MEIRVPSKLLTDALALKKTKQLALFTAAKLEGHRSKIKPLLNRLKIHPKTGDRLVKKIVSDGWAGTDGTFLFPRSWRRLKLFKRGGRYLTNEIFIDLEESKKPFQDFHSRLEALAFTWGLKQIQRKKRKKKEIREGEVRTRILGELSRRNYPSRYLSLPTKYLSKFMGLKIRRFERLKVKANKYGFIKVKTQKLWRLGKVYQYEMLKETMPDIKVFAFNGTCYGADISRIRINI
jgi:hypothetical protein